ncbi:hypothetical protein JB92DRAFT_3131203 [Gautieria morchelliformis]|nr:hypothetical protein JB92DRAFT_3131203 [Gautieria morchelliformis]
MAPEFIRTRPVTRLALGCHIPTVSLIPFSPSLYGFTVFPHIHLTPILPCYNYDIPDAHIWTNLGTTGNDIRELFAPIVAKVRWRPNLGLRFPNVVKLQLELCNHLGSPKLESPNEHLEAIGKVLENFKSLKSLMLLCHERYSPLYMLSPGDQHYFVHVYQENCPSLKTIVFGSLMVWHLRRLTIEVCRWELELLSPRLIQEKLQDLSENDLERVRDWEGKMACLLSQEPLALRATGNLESIWGEKCSLSLCH